MLLLLAACEGASKDSENRKPDASKQDASVEADSGKIPELPPPYTEPLAAGEWEVMDFDARKKFMRDMLMPAMRDAFREFDAERFAAVGCKTCHGSGVADGTFAMPSSDLPVLTPELLMSPSEDKQAISQFMRMVVKPKVAMLLGRESGSASPIRCSTCHSAE